MVHIIATTPSFVIIQDDIYFEEHAENERGYQLETLLSATVQKNDQIIITDIRILADSTKHLVDIIERCSKKSVQIHIINPEILVSPDSVYNFKQILNEIFNFQSDVVRFRIQLGMKKAIKDGKKWEDLNGVTII